MSHEIAHYQDITVYENFNGYGVSYVPKDREPVYREMSDGVDVYLDHHLKSISPGTDEFNKAVQEDLESNYEEWIEAYFPSTEEKDYGEG